MKPGNLAAFAGALALLLAVGLFVGCSGTGGSGSSSPDSSAAQDDTGLPSEEQQREIMRNFLETAPVKSYSSFEDAEQAAGYHIPRASVEYPVAYALTHLQWFPQFSRPISSTQYTFPPLDPTSIGVEVSPSYFYAGGDETVTSTKPTTVGGKTGWMLRDDTVWVFVFDCGSVDGVKVWCQVTGVDDIGWESFEHFVSTIQ